MTIWDSILKVDEFLYVFFFLINLHLYGYSNWNHFVMMKISLVKISVIMSLSFYGTCLSWLLLLWAFTWLSYQFYNDIRCLQHCHFIVDFMATRGMKHNFDLTKNNPLVVIKVNCFGNFFLERSDFFFEVFLILNFVLSRWKNLF